MGCLPVAVRAERIDALYQSDQDARVHGGRTAYRLDEDALLLERHGNVGGWCRSIDDKGFTFDYAGHIMFSNDDYVHKLYQILLGDNLHWQNREAWVYSKGVHTRYPFQG